MEHIFDSSEESSSGCESGWTLYLQHSNIPLHDHHFSCKETHDLQHQNDQHECEYDNDDDDDDDMSMVSDASSGPPHFQVLQDDEDEYNNNISGVFGHSSGKRRKILKETSFHSCRHLQDLPASLDDTASSPFFSFSSKDLKGCNKEALMEDNNSFDYSQGHSTNYFEMV